MATIIIPTNTRLFPEKPVGIWLNGRVVQREPVEQALDRKYGTGCVVHTYNITSRNDAQDVVVIIAVEAEDEVHVGMMANLEIGGESDE